MLIQAQNLKFGLILTLLATLSITGCSNTKSAYDFDSSFDFSQIKTYQWNKTPSASFASANPLIDKRIIKSIDSALNKKRFNQSESADVIISYTISIEKKLSSSGVSTGVSMSAGKSNRGHISLSSGNQLRETIEGTLVIDILSAKDNALLWRGTGKRELSSRASSPEKSQSKINESVNELLENFPPPTPSN